MQSSGEWSLPEKHILAWLMMVEGIGQSRLRLIVLAHKKGEIRLSEIWRQPAILVKLLKLKKIEESIHILQNEYTPAKVGEWLVRHHIHIITEDELVYPPLLKQIHRPPIMLFCQGALDKSWWDIPVAVVGSRHMTEYGRMVTNTLVAQLVELGASIVSGGMYGVDLTAHQAAVKNQGKTLILLGYGFGHSYPAWIQPKHQTILEGGGVIMSQFAPLSTPTKGSFVARNRLVAGLSQTVLVVEAAVRSGTHLTVEFALDEGRDVCAVPGPIGNPYSQGTKWLINQGARLVTSGVEIISPETSFTYPKFLNQQARQLPIHEKKILNNVGHNPSPISQQILSLLQVQPLSANQVLSQMQPLTSGLKPATLSLILSELTDLEMRGQITRFGQYYRAIS